MHDFYNGKLPEVFFKFFTPVKERHNHNTRFASRSTYSIPKVRTNYGKFNIRFSGAKVWNEIDDETKNLKPLKFKSVVKKYLLHKYQTNVRYSTETKILKLNGNRQILIILILLYLFDFCVTWVIQH